MTATRQPDVKIDIHLYGAYCCFSYCQHTEGTITHLPTGNKFDINFSSDQNGCSRNPTGRGRKTFIEQNAEKACLIRSVTLYSSENFEQFVMAFKNKFNKENPYNYFLNNCSDAIKFAIDYFCPERAAVDAFCCTYKVFCCWFFLGGLGAKCFPSICCTTPGDIFDLAYLLSFTSYGAKPAALTQTMQDKKLTIHTTESVSFASLSLNQTNENASLLSKKDQISAAILSSQLSPSLLSSPTGIDLSSTPKPASNDQEILVQPDTKHSDEEMHPNNNFNNLPKNSRPAAQIS